MPEAKRKGKKFAKKLRDQWMDGEYADETHRPTVDVKSNRVTLFKKCRRVEIDGKEKKHLALAQHEVVRKLIKAVPKRLEKDDLVGGEAADGSRTLRHLATTDPDWDSVILLPRTKKGGGYSIE